MKRRYVAYAFAPLLIALTQPAFAATATKSTPPAARPAYPTLVHKKQLYDSVLSVNEQCPVKGGPLSKNVKPSYVNRQPVGYCCHTCPPIFTEDPAPFLKKLEVTLRDPVDPTKVASYDPKLRVFINQEAYFFAGNETMRRFVADPLRYSGPLTDPISQKRFTATSRSPKTRFKDRTYYFESTLTQRQFAVSPKEYAMRRESDATPRPH